MTNTERVQKEERIHIELSHIGKDMAGINPKLSIYQDLQKKQDTLNDELQLIRKEQ